MDTHALLFVEPPIGAGEWGERTHAPPRYVDDLRALAAIHHLEDHGNDDVSLEALAAAAGLSAFHFHRRFQELMGETPGAYFRRIRLDAGAVLLQTTEEDITTIATAVRYGSLAAFSRAFRRQFGRTPQAFRKHSRAAVVQPQPEDIARAASVRVAWRPETTVLAMRFHGGYHRIEECWLEFAAILRSSGVNLDGLQAFGVIRDNPQITPTDLIRYDCAVSVEGILPAKDLPCATLRWPRRRYAQVDHDGGYAEVFSAYRTLSGGWLPGSGEHLASAPALEIYRSPPWRHAGREQHLTLAYALR